MAHSVRADYAPQSGSLRPSHFLHETLKISDKVINCINRGMRNFLWNGKETADKIPLVAWDKFCQAKQAGGVGLRN